MRVADLLPRPGSSRSCVGKSTLAAFPCERLDALTLTAADEADVLNAIHDDFVVDGRKGRLICIMDVARAAGATAPHQTIEKLLLGRLVNTKCVGDDTCIDPCLIVVLANLSPLTRRAPGRKTASTRTTRPPPSSTAPEWKRSATSAAPAPSIAAGGPTTTLPRSSSAGTRRISPKTSWNDCPARVALDAAAAADDDDDDDVDDDGDQDVPEQTQDLPACGGDAEKNSRLHLPKST